MLDKDFRTLSTNLLLDKIFRIFCLNIFTKRYFKAGAIRFKAVNNTDNVIFGLNADLDFRPEQIKVKKEKKNNKVTDSKKKTMKKINEFAKKRKNWVAAFVLKLSRCLILNLSCFVFC